MSKGLRDREFLDDILNAGGRIAEYIDGLSLSGFLKDFKTQDAVVRNLEIIGESSKNVSETLKAKYPEIPWKKLSGLRDKLIHFYFGVDYKIVWNVAKKEIPKILKSLRNIMQSELL
jgi:uncharacterized protein with HEPN domain